MGRIRLRRARRSFALILGAIVAMGALPAGYAGPAAAACPTLGPAEHWIAGYTITGSPNSFFDEADLASDGNGEVTGTITSLNGSVPSPNTIVGHLDCERITGTLTGILAGNSDVIDFEGTLGANSNEIIDGIWESADGLIGGTWSAARVVRSVQEPNATEITSDLLNTGATPSQPLQVSVTSPTAGNLAVQLGTSANPVLGVYQLLDQVVHITAPPATASAPLQFAFVLDASSLLGAPVGEVQVFRFGHLLADCAVDAGDAAIPDPCVLSRVALAGGDVEITVRTSMASIWSFGVDASRGGLRFTTVDLPAGAIGQPYEVSLSGAGGLRPYKWKKLTKLPKGLKLKAKTGVISGIPTKDSGTFAVTVEVVDKSAATKSATLSITVAPTAIQILTVSLPPGTLGVSYSTTLAAADGAAPYKWKKLSTLPKGLKLNSRTGVIAGIPKKSTGTFGVTVQAFDKYGATATKTFSLTVS